MSEKHPQQRKHLFADNYQGYELPDGSYVAGGSYAPDPRMVWGLLAAALPADWSWAGKAVLDLAGNNGYHGLRALREGAADAVLVEQHPKACEKAQEIAEAWGMPLEVRRRDVEAHPWDKRRTFDAIFAHQVLYHLEHPIQILRRIRGALRTGGVFATYTRIALNVHEKHWEWVPNKATMVTTLRYAGFRTVSFHGPRKDLEAISPNEERSGVVDPMHRAQRPGQRKVLVVARP